MPETLAAVDVGTNSLHLVVARTTEGDRFEVVSREKEMVRLGSGSTDMKELSSGAVERAVAALDRFRRIAESHGAPLRAVATSAVREAENREVLLRRARDEAGVEIEVVSGVEEARLIHLGVLQALEVFDRRILLCDIGGGSTELLLGERGEVLASVSLKLGAVRLTNRFFATGTLHPSAVDSCRRHVQEVLSSFDRPVREIGCEQVIGSSGTIEQVLRLARGLAGEEPLRTLNGALLTRKQIGQVVEAAIAGRRDGTTSDLVDLDPKRADILLAGVLVLEGVVKRFGIKELAISEYALREGVFLDTIARRRGGSLPHLRDVARRSVVDLMRACDEDSGHSEHVAALALELFDATAAIHGLGAEARALLEAGALLANVGLVISHGQHHKHSYYLIRNSDRLVGFTDAEIEVVAQIARYHRKSSPKPSHPEWAALSAEDQGVVRVGAAVLRIAIGLDRSHARLVIGVGIDATDDGIDVVVRPVSPEADPSLEVYAAGERSGLLADVLGRPVRVVLGST
ncbi:MAG: exopolyphosphatase [Acidimicrobiales bacterium]|nr:exopolyphosphatase [Acidimicrobiales bacterium]